ncbi:MAG: hypothetical protein WBA41_32140 [Rivularia sp. (in: cyanobacteria)]
MLQVLQAEVVAFTPTAPYKQTPSVISAAVPATVSAPQIQKPPTIVNLGMKDWQKATIIGIVIGVCAIAIDIH